MDFKASTFRSEVTKRKLKIENQKFTNGFTLIELITFITVAGIFVPLAYIAFQSVIKEGGKPETIIATRFIAEQKMEEITSASPWQKATAYTVGSYVWPVTYNAHVYKCTVAGTSGSTAPSWPTGESATVVDGGVTWQEAGNASYSAVAGHTGYQWKWTIGFITWNGNPPVIADSVSATNYQKITVYVREPNGFEYIVYTIVTKRPTS